MSYVPTRIPAMGRERSIRERQLLELRGIPSHTPAEPIRAHVLRLKGLGLTDAMIARAAGVTETMIDKLHAGERATVRIRHAAAIMKVTHRPHPRQACVPVVGARRRLQALQAAGYSLREVAEHTSYSGEALHKSCQNPTVTYRKWVEIRDAYEKLSATPGPNRRAAANAARQKWPLPMEWEGYDIDDPRVKPRRARRTTSDEFRAKLADRKERVQELTGQGFSSHEIADFLGVSYRTVERDRAENAA